MRPSRYPAFSRSLLSKIRRRIRQSVVYATDTLLESPLYLDFVAGLRFDHFSADYVQYTWTTGAVLDLDHTDTVTSPRAAPRFKPTPQQISYLSRCTSFDPHRQKH